MNQGIKSLMLSGNGIAGQKFRKGLFFFANLLEHLTFRSISLVLTPYTGFLCGMTTRELTFRDISPGLVPKS